MLFLPIMKKLPNSTNSRTKAHENHVTSISDPSLLMMKFHEFQQNRQKPHELLTNKHECVQSAAA